MKHLIIILTCSCLCFVSYLNGYASGHTSGVKGTPEMEEAVKAAYYLGGRDVLIQSLNHKPKRKNPGIIPLKVADLNGLEE